MAYKKRIPPIKIRLDITQFNKLVEFVNNMIDEENEDISKKSSEMKDKLLRYSIPLNNDDTKEELVELRFFNNEITDLFHVLFYGIEDKIYIETNYYDILLRVREKLKQENNDKE